jgi:hypothetical protein
MYFDTPPSLVEFNRESANYQGRTNPPRQLRSLWLEREDLECMTCSGNWYQQRDSKFIDHFREHDIPLPFHPEASPGPESQHQTSAIPLTKLEES